MSSPVEGYGLCPACGEREIPPQKESATQVTCDACNRSFPVEPEERDPLAPENDAPGCTVAGCYQRAMPGSTICREHREQQKRVVEYIRRELSNPDLVLRFSEVWKQAIKLEERAVARYVRALQERSPELEQIREEWIAASERTREARERAMMLVVGVGGA